jgi:hypothetical protein
MVSSSGGIRHLAIVQPEVGCFLNLTEMPIDAAHKLAPADDLAQETFDALHRVPVRHSNDTLDDFVRCQQSDIQVRAQQAVKHRVRPLRHRIFIRAELPESFVDEVIQPGNRLRAGRRPAKFTRTAGMIGKRGVDDADHPGNVLIGFRPTDPGRRQRCGQSFAVVVIVAPATANR